VSNAPRKKLNCARVDLSLSCRTSHCARISEPLSLWVCNLRKDTQFLVVFILCSGAAELYIALYEMLILSRLVRRKRFERKWL
jgi:hypothetical protein